jgi:hypothetical protein
VNNMRTNVAVLPYDDHDRAVKLLHSMDRTVWSGKVEAILESEKYETITVDELFSKLKSFDVNCGVRAKIENPTDPHSLALESGSRTNANMSSRQFSLSCLVSMPDEEFDVLGEGDSRCLAGGSSACTRTRRTLGRARTCATGAGSTGTSSPIVRKTCRSRASTSTFEDRPQAPLEGRLQGQEQVRAEAEEEWWSQEEGASDGGRGERH